MQNTDRQDHPHGIFLHLCSVFIHCRKYRTKNTKTQKYRTGYHMKQHIYLLQFIQVKFSSQGCWKAEDNGGSKRPFEHPQRSVSGPTLSSLHLTQHLSCTVAFECAEASPSALNTGLTEKTPPHTELSKSRDNKQQWETLDRST